MTTQKCSIWYKYLNPTIDCQKLGQMGYPIYVVSNNAVGKEYVSDR